MTECPLCKLVEGNIITKFYFETDKFVCVDCISCGIPMVVLKRHDIEMTKQEERYMYNRIPRFFGEDFVGYRRKPRQILDHLHFHVLLESNRESRIKH